MNLREPLHRWKAVGRRLAVAILLSMPATMAAADEAGSPRAAFALAADAAGTLFKATTSGLHRSADAGRTWTKVAAPNQEAIRLLAVPAGGRDVLYAAGPNLGITRLDTAHGEQRAVGGDLPEAEVVALAAHSTQPDTLYAVLRGEGIWRTQDGGDHWQRMDTGPAEVRQLIHTDMKGSMQTGWLYAVTPDKLRISMDCFCLWRNGGAIPGTLAAIAHRPGRPETMYAASSAGIFFSQDGGRSWTAGAAPTAEVVAIAATAAGELFALTRSGELLRSSNGAAGWERADA